MGKQTDEERRASRVETQRKYNAKKWYCELCDKQIGISHKTHHLKTKGHTNSENYKQTDEERRAARLAALRKYNAKKWHCELCDMQIGVTRKLRHLKTTSHINAVNLKPVVDDTNNMTA